MHLGEPVFNKGRGGGGGGGGYNGLCYKLKRMFSFFSLSYAVVSDKVALVIGNQQYQCEKLQGLFYSEKDAYDVAHVLSSLGFKVRVVGCKVPAAVHENKSVSAPTHVHPSWGRKPDRKARQKSSLR